MYQNTGGYSPITVVGLPHVRHPSELKTKFREAGDRLICLTFAAGWCEPSRSLMAQYSDIMTECPDVVFLLADVDECGGIQAYFHVTMVPTIVLIRHMQVIEMWVGCNPSRLRRRLDLYRDPERVIPPPPRRTDLRRIYDLIRDDTYMVTDHLRDEQKESEESELAYKSFAAEIDTEEGWKQRAIRGPKSFGLSFAPKSTFPGDKNWRIADNYITARRNRPPVEEDTTDDTDTFFAARPTVNQMKKMDDKKDAPVEDSERPSFDEHEGEFEDEEGDEWDDELSQRRYTTWYRSLFDEWDTQRKQTVAKPTEKGQEEVGEGAEVPKPRPRGISFAEGDESERMKSLSRFSSMSHKPRSILKRQSFLTDEHENLRASPTWRKMQDEYRRKRLAFTERMMHTELEDREYSRAEVIDLMRRCQRTCTARNLDTQLHELTTDVTGQEVIKSKRQKSLEEAQARAARLVILEAAARSKSTHFEVTPRESVRAPGTGPQPEELASSRRSSFHKESRVPSRQRKSTVQNLRQSIAVQAAHRSSMVSSASDPETMAAVAIAAQRHRDRRTSVLSSAPESIEERRASVGSSIHSSLEFTRQSTKSEDQETRGSEKMLEAVESLRLMKEKEMEYVPTSEPSEPKEPLQEPRFTRVSFESKQTSDLSLRRSKEITQMVPPKKNKLSLRSISSDTEDDDRTDK